MRIWTGVIYILTGVSLMPAYVARAVELPFFLTALSQGSTILWSYMIIGSLLCLGPSLLVLNGVATIANVGVRLRWLIVTGVVASLLLAIWAVSNLRGAEVSVGPFVGACAVALAAGATLTQFLKRGWVGALIGALLAVPLVLSDVQFVLVAGFPGYPVFEFHRLIAIGALMLWLVSLVCIFRFRLR